MTNKCLHIYNFDFFINVFYTKNFTIYNFYYERNLENKRPNN